MLPTSALVLVAVLAAEPGPPAEFASDFPAGLVNFPVPGENDKTVRCLKGRVRILDADGRFSPAEGDLYVTLQADGTDAKGKPLVLEVFHFDAKTLGKLRADTGRKGEHYTVFLPWPPDGRKGSRSR